MSYSSINADSPSDDLHVLDILHEMRLAKLENSFIFSLMEKCQRYVGIRDLMELWFEETDSKERDKIIADLQECIDEIDYAPQKAEERPYLRFDDLEVIKQDVISFKKQLRTEVDRQGGISDLARKTGIPQASLSRMFSSASMPRRTTLFKIAKALNLSETSIGFKWIN